MRYITYLPVEIIRFIRTKSMEKNISMREYLIQLIEKEMKGE